MNNVHKSKEELIAELSQRYVYLQQAYARLDAERDEFQLPGQYYHQQGIVILKQRRIRYVNDALLHIFGYQKAEELLNRIMTEVLAAPESRNMLESRAIVAEMGALLSFHTWRAIRKDGSRIWIQSTGGSIAFENGTALLGFFTDVTERQLAEQDLRREISERIKVQAKLQYHQQEREQRVQQRTDELERLNIALQTEIHRHQQTEAALRASEERFRHIVEASIQGVCIHQEGVMQFANRALATMLGYDSPDELIGQPYEVIVAPKDRSRLETLRRARLRGEEAPSQVEFQACCRDGSFVWLESVVSYLMWRDQPALLVAFVDLTERKRLESEQLRRAQKIEVLGALAGGVAHDFNNVLGAMLFHSEVAKGLLTPDSPVQDNLQNVLVAANRAKDLVQQILTFGRQTEMRRQTVHLSCIVVRALSLLRASLPTTIDIRQALSAQGDTICADPTQMYQILLNLCVNAEHAMRETGGVLDIKVEPVDIDDIFARAHPDLQPGPYVQLTVRDSGHGITTEVMARIFDPFFTTKNVGEGTGMGLAMVHDMVTSHGGAIVVESTPDTGTQFTLYFPYIDDTVDEDVPYIDDTVSENTFTQEAGLHGMGHIMVVDDEPLIASGMQDVLTQAGYEVVVYTSSEKALAAFDAQPERFDLVITDQTMPHLTGEELARELKQRRFNLPIVLCTGFSHVINAESASEQGIDVYCMKPIDRNGLMATIEKVLRSNRSPVSKPSLHDDGADSMFCSPRK